MGFLSSYIAHSKRLKCHQFKSHYNKVATVGLLSKILNPLALYKSEQFWMNLIFLIHLTCMFLYREGKPEHQDNFLNPNHIHRSLDV